MDLKPRYLPIPRQGRGNSLYSPPHRGGFRYQRASGMHYGKTRLAKHMGKEVCRQVRLGRLFTGDCLQRMGYRGRVVDFGACSDHLKIVECLSYRHSQEKQEEQGNGESEEAGEAGGTGESRYSVFRIAGLPEQSGCPIRKILRFRQLIHTGGSRSVSKISFRIQGSRLGGSKPRGQDLDTPTTTADTAHSKPVHLAGLVNSINLANLASSLNESDQQEDRRQGDPANHKAGSVIGLSALTNAGKERGQTRKKDRGKGPKATG